MHSETLAMLGSVVALTIDADSLCQIAEDAIAQDKSSTMTDALVVARHRIELLVAKSLDVAMSEALDRHATPRSLAEIAAEAEVIPHITAAQADDMRRVLTGVGRILREQEQL